MTGRVSAAWVAAVLLVSGAVALLWTAWSPSLSWLLVAAGLLVAGGFVAWALHLFEERQAEREQPGWFDLDVPSEGSPARWVERAAPEPCDTDGEAS